MWVTPPAAFTPIESERQIQWLQQEPLEGVRFKMLEVVRVVGGVGAGETGQLISIFAMKPEPLYHVETSSGEDLYARESELEPLDE